MRHLKRLTALVSFAFLLGSVSVTAQNANTGAAQMQGLVQPSIPAAAQQMCPISLRAQHGADGTMRQIDKHRPEGIAQLLHLILTSRDSRQIVEAHLRVRGASGKGQVSRTDTLSTGMDATRNVIVRLRPSAENEVTGDAWVRGMSAVLEVELNWVTFADGGMQRFGASQGCRFTPEHLMLVADR
jgi:hypothetical protein